MSVTPAEFSRLNRWKRAALEVRRFAGSKPENTNTTNQTMNRIQQLIRGLTGFALFVAGHAGLLATNASAASIKFETKVAGYSSAGWILVLPELSGLLGGRVRYDSARGRWITDRVQRGEPLRVTVSPATAAERANGLATLNMYSTSGWEIYESRQVYMTFIGTMTIPMDPSFRDVVVDVWTESSWWVEKTIPIGPRP